MLLQGLLILLVGIVVLSYWANGSDVLSPAVLFGSGFAVCAAFAVGASGFWAYRMSGEAFLALLGGVALFCLASTATHAACSREPRGGRASVSWELPVSKPAMLLMAALLVLVFLWTLQQISQMYPAGDIGKSISLYNQAAKFTDEGAESFAFPLGPLRSLCGAIGYVALFLLAQELACRRKGSIAPLAALAVLAIGVSMETGSRTGAVGYVFCFGVVYLLVRKAVAGESMAISPKALVAAVVAVVGIVVSFQASLVLIGRESDRGFWEYLSVYVGAQIPNLDTFLHSSSAVDNSVWGNTTFRTSIVWLGSKLGIPSWVYQFDLPFLSMNGHGMGNVYTTFYAYIHDFGYLGMVVLTVVMAVVSQLVYEKARRFDSGRLSFVWAIVASQVAYALFLSFFSNKFYEGVFSIGMLRTVGYLLVVYVLFVALPQWASGRGFASALGGSHAVGSAHTE